MMSGIAKWFMEKRLNAMGVVFVTTLIPWCFWLGSIVCALVVMRKNLKDAAPVLAAAVVPALFWAMQGNTLPLSGLIIVVAMAMILRARVRWSEALIGGAVVNAILQQVGLLVPPDALAFINQLREQSSDVQAMFDSYVEQGVDPNVLGTLVMSLMTALLFSLLSVAVLAMARYLQASLYNPGGFKEEFHAFKLSPLELGVCIAISLLGLVLGMPGAVLVAWLPLLIAGIALIHGLVGLRHMSWLWLALMYSLMLMTAPAIVIVLLLAFIDVFANFRARIASK